ncbi:hypothetical protein [uncultured Stenotrophomonas sp.]|uniref:hypothetical protein n=1 Tax=uncultured Stenotrophomonas sp. TaxID=165438 RepID=UPI0025D60AE8|nr:hypothetical protein [uncultured Stenotrophomonas sp.]
MATTSGRFRHPLAHLSAAITVVAVHAALALWLLQARQPSSPDSGPRISLRWLPPPPASPPTRQSTHTSTQVASTGLSARERSRRSPGQQPPLPSPQTATAAPAPLNLSLAESAAGGNPLTADSFAQQPFRRLNQDPAFQHVPRYFRLKPQMSPKQMIQGVASYLGFWPPGYEVDPCTLSRRDVSYFQNAVSARDRDALHAALLQESARCRH